MEAFAIYIVKSVACISGFSLVYILFLKNERFFFLNRIYLVAGILSSFFLPLISFHYTVNLPAVAIQPDKTLSQVQANIGILQNLKVVLLVLYVSGLLFVLFVILKQAKSLLRSIRRSEIHDNKQVKLIKTSDYAPAFSFFSYVFVNPSLSEIEAREIMNHEMAHIRQKHWIDLLLVELLRMIQWFNPLVWMYVHYIRQNHEYLADEVALQQTTDPAVYKAVLLNQIVGVPAFSLSSSFNYSPYKKRFKMMKNIITSPYRKMRILLILPVIAIIMYSFAKPDYKYSASQTGINVTTDTTKSKNTKTPPPPPPPPSKAPASLKNPPSLDGQPAPPPPPAKIEKNVGEVPEPVMIFDVEPLPVIPEIPEIEQIKVETDIPVVIEDVVVATDIQEKNSTSLSIKVKKGKIETDGKTPLVILDGRASVTDVNSIDSETIETITILKDNEATKKYGEQGKNGVIEIVTKNPVKE